MNSLQFSRLFPVGSHLCREPMPPMSEMKRDMETLKRNGFNLVKLQEQWMLDEPEEGRIELAAYEELIAHAARLDMGVYLGLTCEQAPAWLYRRHPDCHMVGRNGQPIRYEAQFPLPADGKPGPCFDHPGAEAAEVRFITQLVERLGRFENVVIWNTWQEIAYWADWLVGQPVCYCDHTLERFRDWLKVRHKDLDGLNRAWRSRYADWSEVAPEFGRTGRGATSLDVHWGYFMDNIQIARVLQVRADAIRAADPMKRPVFAHKAGAAVGSGQDWAYARASDFVGASAYPAWNPFHGWDDRTVRDGEPDRRDSLVAEAWSSLALGFDSIRSSNVPDSPVWASEFQGGPVSDGFHLGRIPSPADIRRWMLTAAASGVTAISFWVTRAEIAASEGNGFSLLDSEGDTSARLEEAGRVGRALNRYPDLFAHPTTPQAPVAIVVDEWNHQLASGLGRPGEHHAYSVRGWHRLLWDAGIEVDFVNLGRWDELRASHYGALILPFPISLSEEKAARLAKYVESGGHLISEACPGRYSKNAFARRGELSAAMRNLFGVKHTGYALVREPEGTPHHWTPDARTWSELAPSLLMEGEGPLAGHRLRAQVCLETYESMDSTVTLRVGGQVAGVTRTAGMGQAWLVGTLLGHSGTAHREPETTACVLAMLAKCGVKPARPGRLLLRKRVGVSREAWFFTNPTDAAITEAVNVRDAEVDDLLDLPFLRDSSTVHLTVEPLDVRVLIVER